MFCAQGECERQQCFLAPTMSGNELRRLPRDGEIYNLCVWDCVSAGYSTLTFDFSPKDCQHKSFSLKCKHTLDVITEECVFLFTWF